jgi:hypothetical protein
VELDPKFAPRTYSACGGVCGRNGILTIISEEAPPWPTQRDTAKDWIRIRSGTRPGSFTNCTCARSATATATAWGISGLTGKLDYLKDLGVTALWLLPFYPSPLRDDGYDIADYYQVHPAYGTLRISRSSSAKRTGAACG